MEKYPDITVTVNTGVDPNVYLIQVDENSVMVDNDAYSVAMENYITQLNMRLMNGSAEDIFLAADLPVQNYINMGVFEDLSFYLDNSPEINNDNHFMNVINSFKDENSKIWHLPISFNYKDMIYFDKQLVEESGLSIGENVNSMTYEEALDFGISLLENTNREDAYLTHDFHSVVYTLIFGSIYEFINIKDKEVNLDSDEFISLLEKMKELNVAEYYPDWDTDFINSSWFDNYYVVEVSRGLMHNAYESLMENSEMYSALPMSDSKGNTNFVSFDTLAINSASENKDISWEFIKFLLSHEIQSTFFDIPVNRSLYESYLQTMVESNNCSYETEVEYDAVDQLLQGWISQFNNYNVHDNNILTIIYEEINKFIVEELSAEQTAQALHFRVDRYVQETF